MPAPVGSGGNQPASTPGTQKTVSREGQTLKQIGSQFGLTEAELLKANPQLKNTKLRGGMEIQIPDSNGSKPAPTGSPAGKPPGNVIDLQTRVGQGRSRVDKLLGKGRPPQSTETARIQTTQMKTSANIEPQSVDKNFVLQLADKSTNELQSWYESASDSLKQKVQGAFSKIDASTLPAGQKSRMQKLGKNLHQLQLKHNQEWATIHYGKMSEKEIVLELQNKTPEQAVEDLGYLSTGITKGGDLVREKFVSALGKGMRTRQSGTSPSVNYPMISPGHIYGAAAKYKGPGAAQVKAEAAKMLYTNSAETAKAKYPSPDPKLKEGGNMGKRIYDSKMKEVVGDRAKFVRAELSKSASTLARLMGSNPAGFVMQMEDNKQGAKIFPEILTAVARSEYNKDPKKGAEFIGRVIGSTAAEFGKTVAGSDYKKAQSMGNDLGFVLASAEIAIGNVAKEEHAKIDFGKDVLGFATQIIKKSKIPGASQIAEITDSVVDEMAKSEKGAVDGWRDNIFVGFKALILETYDKVSPYAGYPIAGKYGKIHQQNQDLYEVGYQLRYAEVLKGY